MRAFCQTTPRLLAVPAILVALGVALLLGACNTTAGVGKDVSATGNAVTESADKVKQSLP